MLNKTLQQFISEKPIPKDLYSIKFNCKNGNIGLRGVDSTNPYRKIEFCTPEELDYPIDRICNSSRSITLINVELDESIDVNTLSSVANKILNDYRANSYDVLLASFKGNAKDNSRRRRLDFKTARAILEEAILCIENTISLK